MPSLPYIQRPEIKLQGLSDYVFLDDEKALNEESLKDAVEGVSTFDRQGMFRRRYWYDESDGALKEQTVFVENYAESTLCTPTQLSSSIDTLGTNAATCCSLACSPRQLWTRLRTAQKRAAVSQSAPAFTTASFITEDSEASACWVRLGPWCRIP